MREAFLLGLVVVVLDSGGEGQTSPGGAGQDLGSSPLAHVALQSMGRLRHSAQLRPQQRVERGATSNFFQNGKWPQKWWPRGPMPPAG